MNTVADIKASHTIASVLASHGIEVRRGMACCPFHDDENPSLSVKENSWKCFAGCGSGDVIELLAKFEGKTSVEYLRNGNGTTPHPESKRPISHPSASNLGKPVAIYRYCDETDKEVYQVRRYEPKDFRPYLPDAASPGLKNVTRVPYRLPEILAAETVWITEGEKDSGNLAALGIAATCRAGGSSSWEPELTPWFKGKNVVICGDNDAPGRAFVEKVEAALKPVAKSIRRVEVPSPSKDISDFIASLPDNDTDIEARAAVEALSCIPNPLDALLAARRFDLLSPPPAARAIYGIGASTVSTPGNLTVIAAQAKAGKSALVGGFIAATTGQHGDTLGIVSSNPENRALIHFDTEQSPADHHGIVATALRRVTATSAPSWLRSYRIVDVPMRDRFGLLEYELDRARVEHGGIHSVLLDGAADFIADPNDSAEAFAAVERLHRLAVTFDTSIVCVLHFNPGSEFNKTRGHLGSQLERKAETNLALEKADGVTVVYTKMARHAHIEKDAGARFQWDADAGMHVSCGTVRDEKADQDDFTMRAVVDDIFSDRPALRYGELHAAIMKVRHVKETAAENMIKKIVPKYVRKGLMGMYEKA